MPLLVLAILVFFAVVAVVAVGIRQFIKMEDENMALKQRIRVLETDLEATLRSRTHIKAVER